MNVGAIATPALGVVEGDDLKRGTIPWVRISLPMRRELPVKPRILIVEDEVMIRIFMRDVFEEAGFKTREAANADEALELLKAEEFAAILSDIEMPGTMTGVDLRLGGQFQVAENWPHPCFGSPLTITHENADEGQIHRKALSSRSVAPNSERGPLTVGVPRWRRRW